MRRTSLKGVVLVVLLAATVPLLVTSCAKKEVTLIPREVIFGNPEKVAPRLSPDGTRLAYIAPLDGVLNVWIRTIGKDDDKAVTKDANRGIYRYFWAEDGKHIMYLQDLNGDENWLLYAVNLESGETNNLTPFPGIQVEIVDQNKRFPDTIIISTNQRDPRLHDVYSLNLTTGQVSLVAENPGNVVGWVTDYDLKVRGAIGATPDGGFDLLIRDNERAPWKKLLTWGPEDNLSSHPIGFTKDGLSMYLVDSRGVNAGRLVLMDLATGATKVLAEDPQYDVSDYLVNPDTYEVEAVGIYRARIEWTVLSEAVRADFDAIARLDQGDFGVSSRDNADKTWIVHFIKDNGPVSYYSYDRTTKKGTFLFDHRADLKNYTLSPMEPIAIQARDDLTLNGYATYPNAGKARKNLPMVVDVHGGPWARDGWGYNPEAQWLANRGYLCLQVNYRGSTGYGKEFLNAGDKEWGGKMHDDIIDAVNWAVKQGMADPKRVGIFGASYGGYESLVAATFTPDVFKCAVSAMGPSNLVTFIESVPPYWTTLLDVMYKRIGNPSTEKELLESRSPLFKVDAIKIPMLVAQGANDPRVKQAESEQIVKAMKDKGIAVEYLLFPDEGHGFAKPENRLKFYGAAEKFLAQYLGGRYEEEAAATGTTEKQK